jgi:hypothetical protein
LSKIPTKIADAIFLAMGNGGEGVEAGMGARDDGVGGGTSTEAPL